MCAIFAGSAPSNGKIKKVKAIVQAVEGHAAGQNGAGVGVGRSYIVIALCFMVNAIESYDITALSVTAPLIIHDLSLSYSEIGWIFAFANIGLVIGASLGGRISDKVGRKPTLIASVLAFGLFTLTTIWAWDFATLCAIRFAAGVGFGAAMPILVALAAEASPPHRRAATTTLVFCGAPVGGMSVSFFASAQAGNLDWRFIFAVGGGLALICAALLKLLLRETGVRARGKRPVQIGMINALFAEGRALPTVLIWIIMFVTFALMFLFLNWMPLLVLARGFSQSFAPQVIISFSLGGLLAGLFSGPLIDRFGFYKVLLPASLITMAGTAVVGGVTQPWAVLVITGLVGFFLYGTQVGMYAVAASYYPKAIRGTGVGTAIGFGRIGSIAGPVVTGILLGSGMAVPLLLVLTAPLAGIVTIAIIILAYRRPLSIDAA